MSDPTGAVPAEGAPVSESTPEAAPEWASGVIDRVGQLSDGIGEIRSQYEALAQRLPQPEPEQQPDPWAALMPQVEDEPQYFDQYGQPVEMPQQQPGLDLAALQAAVAASNQQAVAPLQQQLAQMQLQQQTEQLYKDIPQLAKVPESHPDYATNEATRQATHAAVVASLQNYPAELANRLAADPNYIATVFKAAEADKRSQAQVPASTEVPALEAAGGAVPGGNGQAPNPIQSAYEGGWSLPKGLR